MGDEIPKMGGQTSLPPPHRPRMPPHHGFTVHLEPTRLETAIKSATTLSLISEHHCSLGAFASRGISQRDC